MDLDKQPMLDTSRFCRKLIRGNATRWWLRMLGKSMSPEAIFQLCLHRAGGLTLRRALQCLRYVHVVDHIGFDTVPTALDLWANGGSGTGRWMQLTGDASRRRLLSLLLHQT